MGLVHSSHLVGESVVPATHDIELFGLALREACRQRFDQRPLGRSDRRRRGQAPPAWRRRPPPASRAACSRRDGPKACCSSVRWRRRRPNAPWRSPDRRSARCGNRRRPRHGNMRSTRRARDRTIAALPVRCRGHRTRIDIDVVVFHVSHRLWSDATADREICLRPMPPASNWPGRERGNARCCDGRVCAC